MSSHSTRASFSAGHIPEEGEPTPRRRTVVPANPDFDVFICHNSSDKPEVRLICNRLKARGLKPWLDEEQLRPGLRWQRTLEEQIERIAAVAVFVGPTGIGPWQHEEMDAFLREFVARECPVIPVLLGSACDEPRLPVFLRGRGWIDFRRASPDPLERLVWGITGERPPSGDT